MLMKRFDYPIKLWTDNTTKMAKENDSCIPFAIDYEHFSCIVSLKRIAQSLSMKKSARLIKLTSRSVGLPLKNSVVLLLFGGLNLKLRKAHPLAIASKGAGPSYGNPRPTNS